GHVFVVYGGPGLLAAASFMQEATINSGKADLFNQPRDDLFRFRVVTGDENRASLLKRPSCVALGRQMFEMDRVQAFDQSSFLQVRRHQFARSSLVIVEFSELPVAVRVIIPGVDDDFALKGVRW